MKTKILMSVLAIGLAVALIGGATSAWFTDKADIAEAEFTAGTVEVRDGKIVDTPSATFKNINPGDTRTVKWEIKNIGTKKAEFRVKLDKRWFIDRDDYKVSDERFERLKKEYGVNSRSGLEALMNTKYVTFEPANNNWVKKGNWLYYVKGPVEKNEKVELELDVTFDGKKIDNRYMGAKFALDGVVEAVQASNDAPKDVWGENWKSGGK